MTIRDTTDLMDWLLTPLSWALENYDRYSLAWVIARLFNAVMLPFLCIRAAFKVVILADTSLVESVRLR